MVTTIRYDSTSYYTYHVVTLTRGDKSTIAGVFTNMEGAAIYVQRTQTELASANVTGCTFTITKFPHNEGIDVDEIKEMIEDEAL